MIKEQAGELVRLEREALAARKADEKAAAARVRKAEEKACESFADYHALAVRRGYENPRGWANLRISMKASYRRG